MHMPGGVESFSMKERSAVPGLVRVTAELKSLASSFGLTSPSQRLRAVNFWTVVAASEGLEVEGSQDEIGGSRRRQEGLLPVGFYVVPGVSS